MRLALLNPWLVSSPMASPLSDVYGRIRHIFFALPAYQVDFIDTILSCMRGIRTALGPDVRCTVLHHPAQHEAVEDALRDSGELDLIAWRNGFVLRLRDTRTDFNEGILRVSSMALPDFTNWVQDAFLVGVDSAGNRQVAASPKVFRHFGGWDDEVPRQLAAHLGWPCTVLPVGVEAGNILVDAQSVLIGSDVARETAEPEWKLLQTELASGGRVVQVCVPNARQPIFHLDLYITIAGPHHQTGKPVALVGSVQRARALVGDLETGESLEAGKILEAGLDAVADHLGTLGYAVERLPLLPFSNTFLTKAAHYTYNNCLVEVWRAPDGSVQRRVTLPEYSTKSNDALTVLDEDAASVWEGLGFTVTIARGEFARVAELFGSLRCMTKVLERSPTM
jgi:hypothetical protein